MITYDLRMSELRGIVVFEIRKLFQEPRYLGNDAEQVIGCGMIVHLESFDCLVIFDDGIERFLFKFLPVLAEIVLCVGVEQKKEVLNVGDNLFKFKIVACSIKVISLFLQLSD